MATLLDFSQKIELRPLGALVDRVNEVVSDRPYLLAGATARDLLLQHAHGIAPRRATADVDLAFLIEAWDQYLSLRANLLASGDFTEVPGKGQHKLRFHGSFEVDLLPFGAVERNDRTIAWPPDGASMTMFGFREALSSCITVLLPGNAHVQIVSLPALTILKFVAWSERRMIEPGKDAHDLLLIIRNYLDAGNQERLYSEGQELLSGSPFDYEAASAWLLGKDMARLLDALGQEKLVRLIADEADESGALRLIGDMRIEPERALQFLAALQDGFIQGTKK